MGHWDRRATMNSETTIKAITDRLDAGVKRLAYLRFGDGQLNILRKLPDGENGYSEDLRKSILNAISERHENYLISSRVYDLEPGMRDGVFGEPFDNDKATLGSFLPEGTGYSCVALHYAALNKPELVIDLFKRIIGKKNIMIVGGPHLKPAMKLFGAKLFGEVPAKYSYEFIKNQSPITSGDEEVEPEVVLFGAGMASTVLQHMLWTAGHDVITLDLGSFFDMLLGIESRQWIKLEAEKVKQFQNLWHQSFPS